MNDADVRSSLAQAALDLHEAAGIRGDDRIRTRPDDVRDLSLEDRTREIRLRDVVRAGAAAAPIRFVERDDVESRDRREQGAWLRADLLTVQKVTRIVPGHPPVQH